MRYDQVYASSNETSPGAKDCIKWCARLSPVFIFFPLAKANFRCAVLAEQPNEETYSSPSVLSGLQM